MTDKERILMCLVNRIYRKALFEPFIGQAWKNMQPGFIVSNANQLQEGDLVTTMTTLEPNEFMVGFLHEKKEDFYLIREIGSNRLVRYYNEQFLKIDKSLLGYEILEGTQYKTYKKVTKAFSLSNNSYGVRFAYISFDGDICTIKGRKAFSNDVLFSTSFKYNSKTTIKSIVSVINDCINEVYPPNPMCKCYVKPVVESEEQDDG